MHSDHLLQKSVSEQPIFGWSTFIGIVATVVQTAFWIIVHAGGRGYTALAYFVAVNLLTYIVNSVDKCIAKKDDPCCYRVPEKVLHFFTFASGAPATALAMWPPLRHKCSKRPYQNWYIGWAVTSTVLLIVLLIVIALV